jgi:hypothetical protein
MSPPEIWGPPVWTFFHTLAEKINEDYFHKIKFSLFFIIKRICNFLPCPECSQHASRFLARINVQAIKDKNQFKQMLHLFHNTVNKRKRKQLFNFEHTNKYKNYNLGATFNNFIKVYHTKGNMNLLAESFQRSLLIKDLKKWIMTNHTFFKPSKLGTQNKTIVHNPNENKVSVINNISDKDDNNIIINNKDIIGDNTKDDNDDKKDKDIKDVADL